jgi:hypothetical protein
MKNDMRQRPAAVGVTTTTVTAALLLAQGPSAGAADDVTPPTLSLPKSGAPLLGSQVGGDEGPGVNGLMARTDTWLLPGMLRTPARSAGIA